LAAIDAGANDRVVMTAGAGRAALATAILVLTPAAAAPVFAPHYDINLAADLEHESISASVEVRLPPGTKTPASFLLGSTYAVTRAEASAGAAVSVQPGAGPGAPQTIILSSNGGADAGPLVFTIDYSGPLMPTDGINAVAPDRIELSADSLWFPISTNFNARIATSIALSGAPSGFVFASPDRVTRERGKVRIERAMPSQDIAFVAAPDFKQVRRGRLHFYAADPEGAQVQNYVRNGPKALAFFQKLYGPCPSPKIAVAVVDRKNGGGYSRPGYIVVANLKEAPEPDKVWPIAGYIAHELSHAWWSRADFTSEDYWLVESTAEYSAMLFIESIYGAEKRKELMDGKIERASKSGPILGHGRPSNGAVYARGPILLFELEEKIGRPALTRVLHGIVSKESLTTSDFLDALGNEAGVETAKAFEAKLRAD
jgi:hypothetical protein